MSLVWRRFGQPIIALAAVLTALLVTVYRSRDGGLLLQPPLDAIPSGPGAISDSYRALRLPILSRVIMLVSQRYVDPSRVHPAEMLLGGLDYIQRSVAEVLVRHEEGSSEVTVQVDTAQQTFSLADVDRPWVLSFRFQQIFRFLHANLQSDDVDMSEVEYAAANGLLHTLDPHSVLLPPDVYEEMRLGTRGEFGGLGIVISLRDGQLTIVAPIDGTPAARAGLRSMDRIVMIGEETTVNMTLDEAVDRLRGEPGTTVSIWVMREEWDEPRRFEILRAVIHIESVESAMLTDRVGYVQIKNFQGNTYDDLREHLGRLRAQGMEALVLDLRDNPGGLLDQAVQVADAFLTEGVIVTTAGNNAADTEVRTAEALATEPSYPMIVLVNSGSASASEIVAGALKEQGRALVLGQQSFGKGSVQVLFDFNDGSALKLTVAQYLTPGDISIQSVGIVPDIEVIPLRATRRRVDLVQERSSMREADLEAHLDGGSGASQQRPALTISHLEGTTEEEEGAQETPDGEEEEEEPPIEEPRTDAATLLQDFEIRLARDLLVRSDGVTRADLLRDAAGLIHAQQAVEVARLVEALRGLEVDWTAGQDSGATTFDVQVQGGAPSIEAQPGATVDFVVTVTNTGSAPAHRLHAVTRSDNPYFDDRELLFGRLLPGQTRSWTVPIRLPTDALTRADPVRVEFVEQNGHAPRVATVDVVVRGLPRPTFSYSYQVDDVEGGNGDGRIQLGERVGLRTTVRNEGPGRCYRCQVNIKNLSGQGLLVRDGRFDLADLAAGSGLSHRFVIEVLDTFAGDEVEVELTVADFELREEVTERLRFEVAEAGEAPTPVQTGAAVRTRAPVYASADSDGDLIGWAEAGSSFPATATLGDWVRVDVGEGRPGWLLRSATAPFVGTAQPALIQRMDNTPPQIALSVEPAVQVGTGELRLSGVVTDEDRVLDMYAFVGNRKVYYLSNRRGPDARRLGFDVRMPLEPGSNAVLLVARENGQVMARRLFVVRRDAPEQNEQARAVRGEQ